jgi:hypothetical protein
MKNKPSYTRQEFNYLLDLMRCNGQAYRIFSTWDFKRNSMGLTEQLCAVRKGWA